MYCSDSCDRNTLCISQEVKWLMAAPNTFPCFQPPCPDSESLFVFGSSFGGFGSRFRGRAAVLYIMFGCQEAMRSELPKPLVPHLAPSHWLCWKWCPHGIFAEKNKTPCLGKASYHFCLVFTSPAVAGLGLSCRPQILAGRL